MDYMQDEFFDLVERVEDEGGELLDDICKNRKYDFTGDKIRSVVLAGCGNQSLFVVPYDALDIKGKEAGPHPVLVCAVDDDMGRWPRFGGDKYGREEPKK